MLFNYCYQANKQQLLRKDEQLHTDKNNFLLGRNNALPLSQEIK